MDGEVTKRTAKMHNWDLHQGYCMSVYGTYVVRIIGIYYLSYFDVYAPLYVHIRTISVYARICMYMHVYDFHGPYIAQLYLHIRTTYVQYTA